ncbi:MAG: DUF4349 domain-containing protein [Spirochaetales bacterium]|nr:DUF4349 domain-containing protein [Spirochaetales bacterium]
MKAPAVALSVLLILLASQTVFCETGTKRQTLDAVILVENRFEAADRLQQWVETNGGYVVSRLEDRLILRVPSSELEEFVDFLETPADEIIEIQQKTEDISQSLLETKAGIKSKTELFEKALTLIDQTDLSTTLEMESEILSILEDTEELKGRYRKLLGEVALARVQVDFELQEEALPVILPSSFPWINVVDFYRLMREFERN